MILFIQQSGQLLRHVFAVSCGTIGKLRDSFGCQLHPKFGTTLLPQSCAPRGWRWRG